MRTKHEREHYPAKKAETVELGTIKPDYSQMKTWTSSAVTFLFGIFGGLILCFILNETLNRSALTTLPIYQRERAGAALQRKTLPEISIEPPSDSLEISEQVGESYYNNYDNEEIVDGDTLITAVPNQGVQGVHLEDIDPRDDPTFDSSQMPSHEHLYIELDADLNRDANASLPLREGFVPTKFDSEIFELQHKYVVLHQTWKDTCILETKTKIMKSWPKREENLKVIFWTDSLMESWILERFSGTYIYEAWMTIGGTKDAHIKKADVFRVLLIWYYGGVYADLDIKLNQSLRMFLKERLTVLVWEPEEAMIQWTEYEEGSARKTLMLSGFLVSGRRFSDFLGFYVNWIAENHLSGRSKWEDHVIDATGPRIEAEAYYYYTGRIKMHDRLLHVQTYEEFLNYGEHFSETTWVPDAIKDIPCVEIDSIYSDEVLLMGQSD